MVALGLVCFVLCLLSFCSDDDYVWPDLMAGRMDFYVADFVTFDSYEL
jgi:hypothetical protein